MIKTDKIRQKKSPIRHKDERSDEQLIIFEEKIITDYADTSNFGKPWQGFLHNKFLLLGEH